MTNKDLYHKTLQSRLHITECPHCHSKDILFEPTETYCKTCGLVLQGLPEWHGPYKTDYPFGVLL